MLIHRAIKHISGALSLQANWSRWHNFDRKIYCCLTVDLDGHGHRNAFESGCSFLLDLFAQNELKGSITWFYNCREKELTDQPSILAEIKKRNDEVALHCHLEDLPSTTSPLEIQTRIIKEKAYLTDLQGQNIQGFRSGRFVRTPEIISAVKNSGLQYDSSYTYGRNFKVNDYTMNDSDIKGDSSIFKLNNGLLELPVWEPFPKLKEISLTGPPYFITNLIHPFNLVWKGRANLPIRQYYRNIVRIFRKIPKIEFVTMSQACHIWKKQT